MEITIEQKSEFVPEFRNNRNETEPIKLQLRSLTTGERQRYLNIDPVKIALQDASGKFDIDIDYEGLFKAAVTKIENLVVNGKKVVTPSEVLVTVGLHDLFMETVMEIVRHNSRKQDDLNL